MDSSTQTQSNLPYTAFVSSTDQQDQIPPQKSPALIGCGIAMFVTSTLCLISLFILIFLPMSNVASVWFVFNILYLLMAMHCVYAGFNVVERHQIVVSTMIMGILATVGTVPIVIVFCVAMTDPFHYSAIRVFGHYSAEGDIIVLVIIASVLSTIDIALAIAIAVLACHRDCRPCSSQCNKPSVKRQLLITSNMA